MELVGSEEMPMHPCVCRLPQTELLEVRDSSRLSPYVQRCEQHRGGAPPLLAAPRNVLSHA